MNSANRRVIFALILKFFYLSPKKISPTRAARDARDKIHVSADDDDAIHGDVDYNYYNVDDGGEVLTGPLCI